MQITDSEGIRRYLGDDHSGITFNFRPVTLEGLHSVRNTLKTNTAGADDLPMHAYTKNFSVLRSIILDIFKRSFYQSIFPAKMDTAKVMHLYKNRDKEVVGNYRPFSLILIFFLRY